MDVDRTLQTRMINYANRPQDNRQAFRRQAPISNQVHHPPQKLQRINQIKTENTDEELQDFAQYHLQMTSQDQELEPIEEYLQGYSNDDAGESNEEDFSDIHFLE